jgi:hypothetical protein
MDVTDITSVWEVAKNHRMRVRLERDEWNERMLVSPKAVVSLQTVI